MAVSTIGNETRIIGGKPFKHACRELLKSP